jgi:hypothetical protein
MAMDVSQHACTLVAEYASAVGGYAVVVLACPCGWEHDLGNDSSVLDALDAENAHQKEMKDGSAGI